jgi:purine nucleoside permease
LLDLKRVAVLRCGADFDRPYAHQSSIDALRAQFALPGAARISVDNLLRAGQPLVEEIGRHWDLWRNGVPVDSRP